MVEALVIIEARNLQNLLVILETEAVDAPLGKLPAAQDRFAVEEHELVADLYLGHDWVLCYNILLVLKSDPDLILSLPHAHFFER